ncbi:MAG: hypothetical protein ACI4I6_07590 [Hominimerdicola sp.]
MKSINLDCEFCHSEMKARADFNEIAETVYICCLSGKTAETLYILEEAKDFKIKNPNAEIREVKRLKSDHSHIFQESILYSSFETI